MNYDNINDIFSAGVTNMTCLLQDSNSYDGGTLAVSGADFFTFLGKAVPYIYAHGDSYWGIGSDATHLKVLFFRCLADIRLLWFFILCSYPGFQCDTDTVASQLIICIRHFDADCLIARLCRRKDGRASSGKRV